MSRMYFFFLSAGRLISGVGEGGSPLSTTVRPSSALWSPSPAMREADAATAAAEGERDAADVNGFHQPPVSPSRLARERHALAGWRHDRREERRLRLDGLEERFHLRLLVDDVVGHEEAAGIQSWEY